MAVMAGLVRPSTSSLWRSDPFRSSPAQAGTQIYSNAGGHSFSGCPLSRARTENGKRPGMTTERGGNPC